MPKCKHKWEDVTYGYRDEDDHNCLIHYQVKECVKCRIGWSSYKLGELIRYASPAVALFILSGGLIKPK